MIYIVTVSMSVTHPLLSIPIPPPLVVPSSFLRTLKILGNSNGPNAAMLELAGQIREDRRALETLADILVNEEQEDEEEKLMEEEVRVPVPPTPLNRSSSGSSTRSAPLPHAHAHTPQEDLRQEASAAARSFETSLHDVTPPCPCGYHEQSPTSTAAAILWQCQMLAMQFVFLKPLLAAFPFFLGNNKMIYHSTLKYVYLLSVDLCSNIII